MTDFVGTDLNAARRNVVLISVAFIVYALGDGELGTKIAGGSGVSFFGGSIQITNVAFLAYFSCALYLWFMVRYMQEFTEANAWHQMLAGICKGKMAKLYLGDEYIKAGSSRPQRYDVFYDNKIGNTPLTSWHFRGINSSEALRIAWWNIPIKLILTTEAALTRKEFAVYYFPYMLWLAGALLMLQHRLS